MGRAPGGDRDAEGEHHMMTEGGIALMCLQAKQHLGLLATPKARRERHGTGPSPELLERPLPDQHLDFGLLTSRTPEVCCFEPHSFMQCYSSPRKLIQRLTRFGEREPSG